MAERDEVSGPLHIGFKFPRLDSAPAAHIVPMLHQEPFRSWKCHLAPKHRPTSCLAQLDGMQLDCVISLLVKSEAFIEERSAIV